MRVAILSTSFPSALHDPSGHFVLAHAQELASQGHDVTAFVAGGKGDDDDRFGINRVVRLGASTLFSWPGAVSRVKRAPYRALSVFPFVIRARREVVKCEPFDRTIAHWIVPTAWPVLWSIESRELEVRAHGADVRLLSSLPKAARERILEALLEKNARFVFAAHALVDTVLEKLSPALAEAVRSVSSVCAPPIRVAPKPSSRGNHEFASNDMKTTLLTCGRLVPEKRIQVAIGALRELGHSFRLVILGDGPERASLEALARRQGLDVHFAGMLPRNEALAWIEAADCLLHPSIVDAAPSAVREARALGVPVVAHPVGDVPRWAARDDGITLASSDETKVAEAVRRLFA